MKPYSLVALACAAIAPLSLSAKNDEYGREVVNEIKVTVHSDVKELAQGYAQAYGQLSRWVNVTIDREGQRQVLSGVRSIRAVEGVLLIEVGKGALYAVNPRDIVMITDDTATGTAK
ncbi:MAG: hypothetical protein SFV32_04635 [Opitutaceae bacterium]|nr:hypothetical protein [Opitutaceae bacterium]